MLFEIDCERVLFDLAQLRRSREATELLILAVVVASSLFGVELPVAPEADNQTDDDCDDCDCSCGDASDDADFELALLLSVNSVAVRNEELGVKASV